MSDTSNPKLSENKSIPVLDDWVGITEAAELLGYTRQHTYRSAQFGKFKSLHRIGDSVFCVISKAEIASILEAKALKNKAA
jgi:hypothetical protein